MLKVAIVDDDGAAVKETKAFLELYSEQRGAEFDICCFDNAVKFVDGYKPGYDIIFLDIEMPNIDGMSVAHKIRKTDFSVSIIFVTNMAQYAIKGYEVDAADFMVKPITYGDFVFKLDRVLSRLSHDDDVRIQVRDGDTVNVIVLSDVRFVEVIKNKLIYHTVKGDYSARGVLKKEEPLLVKHGFAKCNNYCFVNLWYVSGFLGNTLYVSYGKGSGKRDEIPFSRSKKKEFLLALNAYMGDNL